MNSKDKETTTTFLSEYNMRNREVWCPYCKLYSTTKEVDAKCPEHPEQRLITVTYSAISGRRITGEDELGPTGS